MMTRSSRAPLQRVLLTGATGRVGDAFRHYVGNRYHLRLAVYSRTDLDELADYEAVSLDVANLEMCQEACNNVDTVVHLAADPSPEADFYDSLLDANIRGTFNIFRAAKDQGCRRVIYGSSLQTVEGYPLDVQAHPDSPTWPTNMYGVSKVFGEAVARYFASSEDLSSLVVRIGSFDHPPFRDTLDSRKLSTYVSPRDISQLLVRCIEVSNIEFAIVHGISDNRFKRLDLASTKDTLGYEPQDDAFEVFTSHLEELLGREAKYDEPDSETGQGTR